jgi:DMSO/TMAO reductase YedYZ molybdopterin-dependent catalytic subunit
MHIGYTTVKIQKTERRKVDLNKNNKRVACIIIAFLALAIVLPELAMSHPTPDIMLSGATGTITITPADILAMPTTSGLGGWRSMGGSITTGTFVGVSLQYLCDLVGGISSSGNCSVEVAQTLPAADAYSQSLNYQNITDAAQTLIFYNATTGNLQTPTQPITLIIAYECNGTDLPSSWGAYRLMPVGPEGLVGTGKLSVSSVDTVAVSGYSTSYNPLTYSTCNSNGVAQSTFNSGDDVCFTATGLNSSTAYDVDIVPYQSAWSTGMSIPTPVSTTSITTDGSGNVALTSIYSPAATGQYDVIVKPVAETDGKYDAQDLLITNVVTTLGPGLFVLSGSAIAQPTPDVTLRGAAGTITITPADILAMPTTSGLGGWRSMGGSVTTGTFVGVSLQYLCDLVGGISSGGNCSVEVAQTLPASDEYSQNLTYVNITDAAQTITFYNATTGNLQTPTEPITLIIAYECNGTDLPSSWGSYRLMPVGPEGLVGTGKLSVSSVDTVAVSGYPTGYNSLTCRTCNSNGVAQSTFNSGDNVSFTATGLSPSTAYNVEVVPYAAWSTGMSIPTPLSTTSITTDGSGNVAPTSIYSPAAVGQYDVIVKPVAETDGTYDAQDLLITNVVATPGPGLNVLSEYAIAVTKVTSYKTVIGQGYAGNVTVTIENLGITTETFNVTVYANATYITSQNVTLFSSGNPVNFTFTWDTTGFAYGNYTVSAYAWPAPGETNTANHNCTGGNAVVTIPGDVNGNYMVNMGDVVDILKAFGSTIGMPNYNANCDIKGNGKIDMGDVVIALTHFGQHYP